MSKSTYLGERTVDLSTDPTYKNYTKNDWALLWIERYGQIDGGHHKTWVLDQVARILNDAPIIAKIASWTDHEDEYRFSIGTSEKYEEWVRGMLGEQDENGEYEYEYDTGVAP